MSLVFVTGSPTSGKSAVASRLSERGFEAYDTDDEKRTGISGWYNLATGERVGGFNEMPEGAGPEWLDEHIWQLSPEALDRFATDAQEKMIYLCGFFRQPEVVIKASKYVIWLATDEATIKNRFKLPRNVDWGKEEWQVQRTVDRNNELEAAYRHIGAIIIDSRQPLDHVVDEVISSTTE